MNMTDSIDIQEQRKFLHDLVTPLATALFVADSLSEGLRADPQAAAKAVSQADVLLSSLNKMREMIEEFRAKLKGAS